MTTSFSTRIKRIIAFIIDWNICLLPAVAVAVALNELMRRGEGQSIILILLFLLSMLFSLALIATRDFIFGGRSLGKRIFGLAVVDKTTLQKPSFVKLLFRGIFFFILQIDGIIMLVSGNSISDMAFGTLVVSKKDLAVMRGEIPAENNQKSFSTAKIIIIIAALILAFFAFVASIVFVSLDAKKDSEEYAVAYEYLVNSERFKRSGADPEKLFMNSYSANTYYYDGVPEKTVEFGFYSGFTAHYTVVCHFENGVWVVCEDCTRFK